jgi:hypothetical protein
MKRERKTLLGIIFLMAVLFCPVINAFSNYYNQITIVEHSAVDNSGENDSLTDVDFFDDEQINQISDFFPEVNYVYQIRIPQNRILVSMYPTPIWQPPKIV